MTGFRRAAQARLAGVFVMLIAGLACRARGGNFVRLPLPETESLSVGSETRPGVWLSPGDSVEWDLPSGPATRLAGGYASVLTGPDAGRLRLEVAFPRRTLRESVRLSSDPQGWRGWFAEIPGREGPSKLRLSWSGSGPESAARSLFLNEPALTRRRGRAGRTIVLFLVDTLRSDHVSSYGYRLPTTPILDRYFDGWLRAETCLPAANWTLPSHASLFTSASVARHRVARYGNRLGKGLPTLAESLAAAGFRTLAVTGGGYVDPSFGLARGFDRYAVVPGPAQKAVEAALAMLDQERGEPAFLFFHTYQVHDFAPGEAAAHRLFPDETPLGPDWREEVARLRTDDRMRDPRFPGWIRARYDAALASVDTAFGLLLAGLEREGRLSQTALVFTSDHGEGLCDRTFRGECLEWGHGSPYLFEEELRVPLQIRIPWRPEVRGVVSGNASLLDVAPTLVAAAGGDVPTSFEGRSLLARAVPPGRSVVTEAPPLDALALREGGRKLIRRTGVAQRSLFDESAFYYRLPAEECYDVAGDPQERRRQECAPALEARADRYVASGFPDALVVRVPPRTPGEGRRSAIVRARGTEWAPAIRTFGLPSPPELSQVEAVSEARFRVGRSPVWIAFEPVHGARALEVEASGLVSLTSADGRPLPPGSYRWPELGWRAGDLPRSASLFTTPPAPRLSSISARLSSDVMKRLLSLGYLRGAPAPASGLEPARPSGREAAPSLSPEEVRILRAD